MPANKLITSIMIGGAVGLTVAFIDPTTRRNTIKNINTLKASSNQFLQNYKEHPDEINRELKDRCQYTVSSAKGLVKDGRKLYNQYQYTIQECAKDIKEITNDIRQLYEQSKRYIHEITQTCKETKTVIIHQRNDHDQGEIALPATSDGREVVKSHLIN